MDSLFVVERIPRRLRFRLLDMRDAKWLVPAPRCMALPVADSLKRFLVPLWVFILGMIGAYEQIEEDGPIGSPSV